VTVRKLTFAIPTLPPSVNHYVIHRRDGSHVKSAEATAWERDFPIFSRGAFVTGERFRVTLDITFGHKKRGDIDNFAKLPLDCIAKAGMLRSDKGQELSDANVKELIVLLRDSPADRDCGPITNITIEAIP
jgi:Holliday junction resolvase RusA-like endonuclease